MSNGNALCQTTHKLFYVHPSAYYNQQTTFKHIPKTTVIFMKKLQKWNMNKLHYVALHKLCSVAAKIFSHASVQTSNNNHSFYGITEYVTCCYEK